MLAQLTRRHHRPRDTPREACAADRFVHASTGKNSNTISRDMIDAQRLLVFIAILRVIILPTVHFTRSASLLLRFILTVFALLVLHYLSLLRSMHVERPKHRERMEFMEMKAEQALFFASPGEVTSPILSSIVRGRHLRKHRIRTVYQELTFANSIAILRVRPESLPPPPPACFSHLDILRSQIYFSPISAYSSCVILRQCHFAHPRPHLFTLSSQYTLQSEDTLYAWSITETDGRIKRCITDTMDQISSFTSDPVETRLVSSITNCSPIHPLPSRSDMHAEWQKENGANVTGESSFAIANKRAEGKKKRMKKDAKRMKSGEKQRGRLRQIVAQITRIWRNWRRHQQPHPTRNV